MDTSALKYFITVAQTQHMSRAAGLLNITQPSLSTSIRRLEADLGYQLFDRTGRGIALNEYGRIFLQGVTEAEHIMNSCLAEMEELRKSSVDFVRLACSNSSANSRLIDLLLSQGVNLKVDNISHQWEQELLGKGCDLVITMGKGRHPRISGAELCCQELAVVTSKKHPLAALAEKGAVPMEELHRHAFCSTDAPYSLINVVKEQYPNCGFHPRITFLGRNSADMLKAIETGKYAGLMVKRNLPQPEDLCILSAQGLFMCLPIYLYWRESDAENLVHRRIRDSIIEFYRGLPAE